MLKKLLTRSVLYGLAPQIPRIAGFFALPINTKYLTQLDYGTFGMVTAYIGAFGALQYLGTNVVFNNSFVNSPNHYKIVWRQMHGFLSLWAFVFAFLIGVVLYLVLPYEVAHNKWIIIGSCVFPMAFIEPTLNLTFKYYHLTQQATTLALRTVLTGLFTVSLNIFFIAYLRLGYVGWFASIFMGNLVSFIIFFYPIYFKYKLTPIFNFKIRTVKKNLKISLPAIPHYFAPFLLASSDRIVMDVTGININRIGLYNIAYTFSGYFGSFSDAIGAASGPMYLQLYRQNTPSANAEARKMTYILNILFLLLSISICIWLKEIFVLLVRNKELQQAYPFAIIILMSYNYRPMYLAVLNKLMYREKTKSLWKMSLVAGVLNVILNIIFLPIYGIMSSAIITFISFMYLGYYGFWMKDYCQIKDLNYNPVFWLLATCGAVVFAFYFVEADILIKFIFTLGVVLVALFLFIKYLYTGNTFTLLVKNKKVIKRSSLED